MSDVTGEGRPSTEATTDEPAASDQLEAHELPATEDQQGQESQPPEPVLDAATGGATDEGMEGPIEELPTAEPEPGEPVEAEGAVAAQDESPPPMLEDLAVAEAAGPGELVDSNGEQIAWQPVVDGDQLEWQPIVTSDAGNDDDQVSGIESDVQPDFEYPEGAEVESWDAGLIDPASALSGNGAGAAAAAGAGTGAGAAAGRGTRSGGPRRPTRRPPGAGSRRPSEVTSRDDDADRRTSTKTKRQVIILSFLTVLVIVVGVLGFVLSRDAKEQGNQAATPNTTAAAPSNTIPRLPESALQTYTDEATGFTLKFAKTWEVLRAPSADLRLVVNLGGNDAFNVRLIPIEVQATPENIGNFKAVTDAIVFGNKQNKSIREQLVTVNGLLAYYYLYTFPFDGTTEGVHAQYFVFEGNRMFSITFQSVPAEDFPKQANLWDQVAESFTVAPRPTTTTEPPADTTSTSVP